MAELVNTIKWKSMLTGAVLPSFRSIGWKHAKWNNWKPWKKGEMPVYLALKKCFLFHVCMWGGGRGGGSQITIGISQTFDLCLWNLVGLPILTFLWIWLNNGFIMVLYESLLVAIFMNKLYSDEVFVELCLHTCQLFNEYIQNSEEKSREEPLEDTVWFTDMLSFAFQCYGFSHNCPHWQMV